MESRPFTHIYRKVHGQVFTVLGFAKDPEFGRFTEQGPGTRHTIEEMKRDGAMLVEQALQAFNKSPPKNTAQDAEGERRKKLRFVRENLLVMAELAQPAQIWLRPMHRERGGHRGDAKLAPIVVSLPTTASEFFEALNNAFALVE